MSDGLYWHPETKLVDERRAEFRPHLFPGNRVLSAVRQNRKRFTAPLVVSCFPSHHLIERGANYFPLLLDRRTAKQDSKLASQAFETLELGEKIDKAEPVANLTPFARKYLARLGCEPADIFHHIIAVLHAPAYREENAGALRQDWPRIPLPESADVLRADAALGRELAA